MSSLPPRPQRALACLARQTCPRRRDHWIDLSAGGAPARSSLKLPEAQIPGSASQAPSDSGLAHGFSSWKAHQGGSRGPEPIFEPGPPSASPVAATASSSNRTNRTRPARLAGASAKIRNTSQPGALPSIPWPLFPAVGYLTPGTRAGLPGGGEEMCLLAARV